MGVLPPIASPGKPGGMSPPLALDNHWEDGECLVLVVIAGAMSYFTNYAQAVNGAGPCGSSPFVFELDNR